MFVHDIHLLRLKTLFRSLRVRVRPVDAVNNALLSNYCPTGEVSSEEKNDKLFHKNRLSNASPLHTQHYALRHDTQALTLSIPEILYLLEVSWKKFSLTQSGGSELLGRIKRLYGVSRECGEKFPLLKICSPFRGDEIPVRRGQRGQSSSLPSVREARGEMQNRSPTMRMLH